MVGRSMSENIPAAEVKINSLGDEAKNMIKRNNTYSLKQDEESSILEAMKMQQEALDKKREEENKRISQVFDEKSSSEDDEDFIRQSIINNQKRFSSINNDYMERAFLKRISEVEEDHEPPHVISIAGEETPNGLSVLCDKLNSLNKLVQDKDDRIFTNFDWLLFYLEVSDAIKLQKCSRALWRVFSQEQVRRLVRVGSLDEGLRVKFWIHHSPFFSYQNQVREITGEADFFANVYECILGKLETDPLDPKVIDEIGKC